MESINVAGVLQAQIMLTQGPTPDPKCNLIISSFFTLPHLLDCVICTRIVYDLYHCIVIANDEGKV